MVFRRLMAIQTNPQTTTDNHNFLQNVSFEFGIGRFPNLNFFVQSVTLPGLDLGSASIPTGTVPYKYYSEVIDFQPLTLTFAIDEDMANYIEVWSWMTTVAGVCREPEKVEDKTTGKTTSDMVLLIHTSHRNPHIKCVFREAYPTSLDPVTFDYRSASIDYQVATCTFAYSHYSLDPMTS